MKDNEMLRKIRENEERECREVVIRVFEAFAEGKNISVRPANAKSYLETIKRLLGYEG